MLVADFLVCSMSPTFMLGIWHGVYWLNRDLAQPIYDGVERGCPISSRFIAFINEKFNPFIFMCICTNVYVNFAADMFMIFLSLLCSLYVCFMIATMYGSQHGFTCK